MGFEDWVHKRTELDLELKKANDKLRSIRGKSRSDMGLTPDSIKASSEYKNAKSEVDRLFGQLQNLNSNAPSSILREHFTQSNLKAFRHTTKSPLPGAFGFSATTTTRSCPTLAQLAYAVYNTIKFTAYEVYGGIFRI